MTSKEMENYLLLANYDVHDVMVLARCKATKAYSIMNICKKRFDGTIPGKPHCIRASSYWLYEGTTLESQMRLIKTARE